MLRFATTVLLLALLVTAALALSQMLAEAVEPLAHPMSTVILRAL